MLIEIPFLNIEYLKILGWIGLGIVIGIVGTIIVINVSLSNFLNRRFGWW